MAPFPKTRTREKSVAVIGAGISGLVCAYELQKSGFAVSVFEKETQVGGRMVCRKPGGIPFDTGANFLVKNYAATRAYCDELGISALCVPMETGSICGFRNGMLNEITSLPSRILFKNGNLPFVPRLKMAAWFFKECRARRGLNFYDLSNATAYDTGNAYDYARDHAGRDVADHVVDAFTSAYQFHGAKELSLATMLALLEMLMTDNGGFAMCHTSGGMGTLPDALASRLDVSLGQACEGVSAGERKIAVTTSRGTSEFDAAVLATTADVTRAIYANPTPRQAELLSRVKYAGTVNVSFLVPKAPLRDLGLVMVPESESPLISEYTDESMKGSELVRCGKTLVNVGLHDAYAKGVMDESDGSVFAVVKEELLRVCPLLKGDASRVENYDLQRWPTAMPKFYPGYLTAVKKFIDGGQGDRRVFFCGDYLNSPWIEGSILCGRRVATAVAAALR